MGLVSAAARRGLFAAFVSSVLGWSSLSLAQELPKVAANRKIIVGGLSMDPRAEDLLGLSRVKFQGFIAAELNAVGYRLAELNAAPASRDSGPPPLTLVGFIKEEICDEQNPRQCRVAIQWELQDARGVVSYRTTTRAVEQAPNLEDQRRSLVAGALRSLLQRPRFSLQFTASDAEPSKPSGVLGFKQCRRPALKLPDAARSVAASLVFVESGSNLLSGAIVSPDGLILTVATGIDETAPLRVRFSAEQTLPAEVVLLERGADLALLHTSARTEMTCLAPREAPLTPGMAVFGVSSELNEDRAVSLTGSVLQGELKADGLPLLDVDSRIARAIGAPLLDDAGRVLGIVSARPRKGTPSGLTAAIEINAALQALRIKPAAITDPRLVEGGGNLEASTGYVRDRDDPPFVLGHRYTYGTSPTARTLRSDGFITAGVGAFAVAATWVAFRTSTRLSSSAHQRLVVLNDLGWGLVGLGAVGVGVSYALPESHEVVAVQTAARRRLRLGLGLGGLVFEGAI